MCKFRILRNLLLVIVMQLTAEATESGKLCPKSWIQKQDKCFYVSDQYANFYVAKEKCEFMNSELAPVYSLEDLSRLAYVLIHPSQICNSYDNCAEYWIGVFDSTAQDKWTSTNGTLIPQADKYWAKGYPKEKGRCVLVELQPGKQNIRAEWKNDVCARILKYICILAEPTAPSVCNDCTLEPERTTLQSTLPTTTGAKLNSQAIVTSEENLALNRLATQSSTHMNHDASRAVDGNTASVLNSGSCAHIDDGSGGPNWWRVQLDRPYRVGKVTVTNRGDCCEYCLDYFIVGVTNSTEDPVRGAYPLCGQYPSTVALGATVTVHCDPDIGAGQYVIIQQPINGRGVLTLCEVEVYARTG